MNPREPENLRAVLGGTQVNDVFVWSRLTVRELTALRRAIYPTVLESRG